MSRSSSMRIRSIKSRRSVRTTAVSRLFGVLLATGLITCAGSAAAHSRHSAKKLGQLLTVAIPTQPVSMNPAKDGNGPYIYAQTLAYDALIFETAKGTFVPGLATKWGYVGKGNKTFDLTLRKGVRFSDGTPLTASAVKASIDYFIAAKGPLAAYAASIRSVQARGKYSVRINLSSGNPIMERILDQNAQVGEIISPKALKHPTALNSSTDGAGPYVLQASGTVAGDHYTYVPNKYYWNPSQIHYRKVELKVIATPSSTLQAMEAGQIDFAAGDPSTYSAAQSAGLDVKLAPVGFMTMFFTDFGKNTPALANVKVRQALNYAINRTAVTKALLGGLGKPTSEFPTLDAWQPKLANTYPYDPTKAKQLMQEAGYGSGFTLPVLDLAGSSAEADGMTQAILPYLQAIGVKVNVTSEPDVNGIVSGLNSKTFGGWVFAWGTQTTWQFIQQVFEPTSNIQDGFTDPVLQKLWTTGAASPNSTPYWKRIVARLTNQAYGVPLAQIRSPFYSVKSIKGVRVGPATFSVDLGNIEPN